MLCEQQPRYHSDRRQSLRWPRPAPQTLLAVLVACLLSTAAHGCSDHSAQQSSQQLDHSLTGRRSLQSTDKVKAQLRSIAAARHSVHATAQGHTAQLRKRLQSARDSVAAALAALKAAVARKRNTAAAAAGTAHPPPPSKKSPPPPAHKPATAQLETLPPGVPLGMNTTIHKRACGQPAVSPAEATAVQNRLAPGIISRQTVRTMSGPLPCDPGHTIAVPTCLSVADGQPCSRWARRKLCASLRHVNNAAFVPSQSRAVPIIVNVYITINRIGGAPVVNLGVLQ